MIRLLLLSALLLFSGLSEAKIEGGQPAPDVLGKNAKTGAEVKLSDYAGKIVVLHFWANWCDYCYKTLNVMEHLQEQLGAQNLQVISIAVKDDARLVNKITTEMGDLSMISSVDKSGKVLESFGDDYLPNIWVIGRDGKVIAQGGVRDDEELKAAVKKIESALKAK
jgi:peroxiredoxin